MSELESLNEKRWVVKLERIKIGKGVVEKRIAVSGLDMFEAKVKMDELNEQYLNDGWERNGWTLKHPEKKEIVFLAVAYEPESEVEVDGFDYVETL